MYTCSVEIYSSDGGGFWAYGRQDFRAQGSVYFVPILLKGIDTRRLESSEAFSLLGHAPIRLGGTAVSNQNHDRIPFFLLNKARPIAVKRALKMRSS